MLKYMKAHSHLKPGQNGTHRLMERFGDSLICVRYRYDEIRDVRLTTAEIIVDEKPGKAAPRLRETDYVRSLSDLGEAGRGRIRRLKSIVALLTKKAAEYGRSDGFAADLPKPDRPRTGAVHHEGAAGKTERRGCPMGLWVQALARALRVDKGR